jgi:hypothetical protein
MSNLAKKLFGVKNNLKGKGLIRVINKKLHIDKNLPLKRIKEEGDCEYIFTSKPPAGIVRAYLNERKKLGKRWRWSYKELKYLFKWTRDEYRDKMRRERLAIDSLSVAEDMLLKTNNRSKLKKKWEKREYTKRGIISIVNENIDKFDDFRDIKFIPPIIYGLHLLGNDSEIGNLLMEVNKEKIRYVKKYLNNFNISIDLDLRIKEKIESGKDVEKMGDTYLVQNQNQEIAGFSFVAFSQPIEVTLPDKTHYFSEESGASEIVSKAIKNYEPYKKLKFD